MGLIYEKTVKEIMIEYFNKLSMNDTFSTRDMIKYFKENYPKIKEGTVVGHLILFSINAKSRINHKSHKNKKCDLLYKVNENTYRLYDKKNDPEPLYKEEGDADSPPDEPEDEKPSQEFAKEKDLQNYLVKNLQEIETGLKLFEDDEITGVEYPAGGRYIDILAVDKNNNFVIIELKVSRGYDRAIGQLLRYIGWVEKNMVTEKQKVRGIIVCNEISEDLKLACSKINNIELFEYELSIKFKKYL